MAGDTELQGLVPRAVRHIFDHIAEDSQNKQYLVTCSYVEIYQDDLHDLLPQNSLPAASSVLVATRPKLEIKENRDSGGVSINNLGQHETRSVAEIERLVKQGNRNRATASTDMNEHSSRSHAILIITVECNEPRGDDAEPHIIVGKLNLVDLAGSERQSKTGATGERFREATNINLALSVLGRVINALTEGAKHIPYRDSKLTRLLQDSLGGNAKTIMIANIGPAGYNHDETLNTLGYASRAKTIKNQPKINEDPKDSKIREALDELAKLKALLQQRSAGVKRVKQSKPRKSSKQQTLADVSEPESGNESTEEIANSENKQQLMPPAMADNADDDVSRQLREEREQLEAEIQKVMNDKSMIAEDRERIITTMRAHEAAVERKEFEANELAQKIAALEGKMIMSGHTESDLREHTDMQKQQLQQHQQEIEKMSRQREEIQQRLEAEILDAARHEGTLTKVQTELVGLKDKWHKAREESDQLENRLQQVKEEYDSLRIDHEEQAFELSRAALMRDLIIQCFLPGSEHQLLEERLVENPITGEVSMLDTELSPQLIPRPDIWQNADAKTYRKLRALFPTHQPDNILQLQLELPEPSGVIHYMPQSEPERKFYEAFEEICTEYEQQEDIVIDCNTFTLPDDEDLKMTRSRGSSQRGTADSNDYFPQARGLVERDSMGSRSSRRYAK